MLILAAVREELGELSQAEGGVRCEVVGIGPVIAAVRAARVIERHQPDGVIFIGTAASYPGGPQMGTAVVARTVGLSHGVAAMGLGYVPRQPRPIQCDDDLRERSGLPAVDVLSVSALTTDDKLAERLSDGWQVEHMEIYGVAAACADVGVPLVAILGIASEVGPQNHTLWLTHRGEARDTARAAAKRLLLGVG